MSIPVIPAMRGRDPQGSGRFGARRDGGERQHNGADFVESVGQHVRLAPGDPVLSMSEGKVTKLGYPYAHDLSFRYVQVTDKYGYDARYFYVEPRVELKQEVGIGDVLGVLQRLPYEGIEQHYHFEVLNEPGNVMDPLWYLSEV